MKTTIRTNWTDNKGNLLFYSEQENLNPGPARCFTPAGVELTGSPAENLLHPHVTGKIERGEAVAIKGIPAVPETDNQKIQAYLDWTTNFLTVEKFAEHYGITYGRAFAIITSGRKLHEDSCKPKPRIFTVVTASLNTSSFGYRQVLVLTEDGTGYACLYQAYGTEEVPKRGDKIEESKLPTYCRREITKTTPEKAVKIIAEIK